MEQRTQGTEIIGHNGIVYEYTCSQEVVPEKFRENPQLSQFAIAVNIRIEKYKNEGYDTNTAHYLALKEIENNKIYSITVEMIGGGSNERKNII